MKGILIYDSDHPGALQNKCFEDDYANKGSGNILTVKLARAARQRGYDIVTGDVFLASKPDKDVPVFCLTDMVSSRTESLLKRGAIPFLCFCTESPLIARDFYINIAKLSGRFLYSIQFRGTAERLRGTPTHFLPMYFPVDGRMPLSYGNWSSRKLLVLVNRNKRAFYSNYTSLKDVVRSLLSPVKLAIQKLSDPWIRSKEIYKDRVDAILHFSTNPGFSLYGQGWENRIPGYSKRHHEAAKRAFRGALPTEGKLPTLHQYKFCICFENCSFPGYITEKIFDCFLAGCIPVYYGAPDIADFVPADTFVDFRKFSGMQALEDYLVNMKEADAIKMLTSAKAFLASREFDKYVLDNFIDDVLNKVDEQLK